VHHTFGQEARTRKTRLSLRPLRRSAVQLKTVQCNAVQRNVTQGNVRWLRLQTMLHDNGLNIFVGMRGMHMQSRPAQQLTQQLPGPA